MPEAESASPTPRHPPVPHGCARPSSRSSRTFRAEPRRVRRLGHVSGDGLRFALSHAGHAGAAGQVRAEDHVPPVARPRIDAGRAGRLPRCQAARRGIPAARPGAAAAAPPRMAESARSSPRSLHDRSHSTPSGPSAIEAIVREQLQAMSQLMAKQLDMLRGGGAGPSPPGRRRCRSRPSAGSHAGRLRRRARRSRRAAPLRKSSRPFGPYKPVQKGPVGGLTERQARHLDDLIRRYTARTARSKELTQNHRRVLADPRVAAGLPLPVEGDGLSASSPCGRRARGCGTWTATNTSTSSTASARSSSATPRISSRRRSPRS